MNVFFLVNISSNDVGTWYLLPITFHKTGLKILKPNRRRQCNPGGLFQRNIEYIFLPNFSNRMQRDRSHNCRLLPEDPHQRVDNVDQVVPYG